MLGLFVHLLSVTEERCSNNCIHISNAVSDVTAFFCPSLTQTERGKGINLACCIFELLRSYPLYLLCGAWQLKQNLVLHVGSLKLNAQNEE